PTRCPRSTGRRRAPGAQQIQDRTGQTHAGPRPEPRRSAGMIGDPINRLDGRLKVTGAARYSAEWPIERLAYGVIVQSTIARGTITALDTAVAASLPGVLAVMTVDNAPRLPQAGR